MSLPKPIRFALIAIFVGLAIFFGPLALIVAGNFGGGILNAVLNRKPTNGELIGKYRLDVPWGKAKLQINVDGTFEEDIEASGKPTQKLSGRWQAKEGSNFVAVDFRPFRMVWDDDHDRETGIYGIDFYKPHSGATYGLINDDLGESFKRQ